MSTALTIGRNLGLVANGARSIKNGAQYNQYFDSTDVKGNEVELMAKGTVYDTLKNMRAIVTKTLGQTKRIAQELKGATREKTSKNIFDFLYNHVQYKKDNPTREQLRTPARTWKDRASGVDCDCYSIFISSVLTNLGIPHAFRMAGYKGDYQHVYVVVPKSGQTIGGRHSYYVIDPVVNRFNYETPFTKKHDNMAKVTMLNGVEADQQKKCRPENSRRYLRRFVYTDEVLQAGLVPTKQFLESKKIPYEHTVTEENGGVFLINTPAGVKELPSIITKEQAEQILKMISGEPALPPACEKKKFPWWWVAIGAAGLILLTGDDQGEVKTGLNGVPKKHKRKKLKTIHI